MVSVVINWTIWLSQPNRAIGVNNSASDDVIDAVAIFASSSSSSFFIIVIVIVSQVARVLRVRAPAYTDGASPARILTVPLVLLATYLPT